MIGALREMLANVARHAHATHVDVSVTASARDVEMTVIDDGIGFPVESVSRSSGVANIVARAHSVGGTCDVTRVGEDGGTAIRWRVPLA